MFLEQFAASYPDDLHILQVEHGTFQCASVSSTARKYYFFQPPHTPEVNPIERLWEEIKRYLSWECAHYLNELREAVWQHLEKLTASQVRSITGWDFILDALFVSGIL